MNRTDWTHPDLQTLTGLFYPSTEALGTFQEVASESLPSPWAELLAHTQHMTVTVERHHGSRVDVEVLEKHSTPTHYARRILLRRQDNRKIVQFGIVRLARFTLPEPVLALIESEAEPLGRILIENDVLRKVKLMSLWQITPSDAFRQTLEAPDITCCYGRTALIYANNVPAVELLEIVV